MQIQKQEWESWRSNPTTIEFFEVLKGRLETTKQDWAEGAFTEETADGTVARNAKAIGIVQTLQDIIDSEYIGEDDEQL